MAIYKKQLQKLEEHVQELKQFIEILDEVENSVMTIEREVVAIDESLPKDREIRSIKNHLQRKELNHVLDVLDEAYNLIDQILGPAFEDGENEPKGVALTPEARGYSDNANIEEMLKSFNISGKTLS